MKMTPCQKRCADCAECDIKHWKCNECFGQPVEDIDECPLGITTEQVEAIEKTKIKVETGARAEAPGKKSKPRTVVTSDEKKELFHVILANLQAVYGENVTIEKENKLLIVKINDSILKVDIIAQRKPKK